MKEPWRTLLKKNPWRVLPRNPKDGNFVVPKDWAVLKDCKAQLNHLRLDLHPIPYQGRPDLARVVLLALNPGARMEDYEFPDLIEQRIAGLNFRSRTPFTSLDPEFVELTEYWGRRLDDLCTVVGPKAVTHHVMLINFFPYQSLDSKGIPAKKLDSQDFSFDLVRTAIDEGKLIVLLWGRRWLDAVPKLKRARNVIINENYRCAHVTEENLKPPAFNRIVAKLQGKD